MKRQSLSFKIISRIILSSVILGLFIFASYYFFTRNSIEKATRDNAALLAENTINKIEEVIRPVEMIPQNLAWMMASDIMEVDSISAFLTRLVENNPTIYASAIAFEPHSVKPDKKFYAPYAYRNGTTVENTIIGSEENNYLIMDWYQIPALLGKPYWSEPYYDNDAGALLSTYSVPFYSAENGSQQLTGVITVDISLSWLTDIINSVKIFDTGYAFLISRNGVFVTHPNRTFIMNETIFSLAKEFELPKLREIGRNMVKGKSNLISLSLPESGDLWMYYMQMPATKWSLGVVYPHNEMYAALRKINVLVAILSVVGILLLVLFTVRIVNQMMSPLTRFSRSARLIAEGNFNTELPSIKTQDEMKELHDSFAFMQKELADYVVNLKHTTMAKEKIESELRIAKEIQMGMIPRIFPPFPDLPEIDLFASLESAKEVGGDLYDFFMIDEKKLCFAIGDVSGKGIPASLFMAVTRTLLRSVANDASKDTAEIVSSINKTLAFNNESSMFVTFFLGVLDVTTGEMKFCNAGHNPPVLIKGGDDVEFFQITKGIPLGLFEAFEYQEERVMIDEGDQIFMYTDGLTEAEDEKHALFGDNHLIDVIKEHSSIEPSGLIGHIKKEVAVHVNGHIQSDDLTMLSIIYFGRDGKK